MAEEVTPPIEGENTNPDQLGTEGTPVVQSSDGQENQNKEEQVDVKALSDRLAAIEKERDNIAQERNLLRNKTKELEKKRVEETEDYKSAYEEMLAEKERREAEDAEERERADARRFRDTVIASRSEKTQKAAKALIDKNENNLAWRNARDETDARRQIEDQLDALDAVLGNQEEKVEKEVYRIEANPTAGTGPRDVPFEDLSYEEMKKILPRADAR